MQRATNSLSIYKKLKLIQKLIETKYPTAFVPPKTNKMNTFPLKKEFKKMYLENQSQHLIH